MADRGSGLYCQRDESVIRQFAKYRRVTLTVCGPMDSTPPGVWTGGMEGPRLEYQASGQGESVLSIANTTIGGLISVRAASHFEAK